jgi:hypothetical protein
LNLAELITAAEKAHDGKAFDNIRVGYFVSCLRYVIIAYLIIPRVISIPQSDRHHRSFPCCFGKYRRKSDSQIGLLCHGQVVSLEDMPAIADQMRLFYCADMAFMVHGAAVSYSLFMRPGSAEERKHVRHWLY